MLRVLGLNLLIFLLVWIIVWYIPIPPRRFKLLSKQRLLIISIGLFLFGINVLVETPLSTFVYFLIFTRFFAAIIEYFAVTTFFSAESLSNGGKKFRAIPWIFSVKQKRRLGVLVAAVFLISLLTVSTYGEVQRVPNAAYFNGFIDQQSGLPFNSTIPDNMVRLVTQELATSIARRHMSEFGSNTQVLDCHITKSPEGKLVWVATIGSTNVISENYVKGLIIINANEPAATPDIVHLEFNVGTGLWWDRNIPFRNYMEAMEDVYGVSYVTWTINSEPVYVVTRYNQGFDFLRRYETPIVYNARGTLVNNARDLTEVPSWMTQVYDEAWLEDMTNEMGSFRRGTSFDYFAGGFLWIIPPSRDRFEITEDTRYVVDPKTTDVVALVCVNPIGNQRTLSGVFKATREGVLFYDFKQSNYISGLTAEDLIEGRLPKPATGNYYAVMPLLYTVEITASSSDQRLAWYVPIYWNEDSGDSDETVYLAGFAIVDAQDTNKIALSINQEGIISEQLVRQTRMEFIKLFGGDANAEFQVTAKILNNYQYVQDGQTHFVLQLQDSKYPWIEATPNDLTFQEWNQLLSSVPGQIIVAHLERQDDRWIMMDFAIQSTP
jgi:hypothetical protein